MNTPDYTTEIAERKRGQHLQREQRGIIWQMNREKCSNRAIARAIGCSPTTVGNELHRGTPPRTKKRGRAPSYSSKRGERIYRANRKASHRPSLISQCTTFVTWVTKQVKQETWSLDACVGYAKRHNRYPTSEMVCAKTLYNWLWSGQLPLTLFDVPEVLKRKKNIPKAHKNVRIYGTSIEERPTVVGDRTEFGHWEWDTVVGKKKGKESVVLTMVEMKTDQYIAIKIPSKTINGVNLGLLALREEYGEQFSQVFKTATADNGSEFADLSLLREWGTKVFYAHPYSSWERPINERHNGLFRRYIPKGVSIENYSAEQILSFADSLNALPRKFLDYATPEELFEDSLDAIFAS